MARKTVENVVIVALVALACAASASADELPPAMARGKAFWLGLAEECRVPSGDSAFGLVREAVSLLGSPDPVWRDDIGYGVVASCVYRTRALSLAERRELVDALVGNLGNGIGRRGDDSVLLRSFSALDLSILAALELSEPALDDGAYRRLLDGAFGYLAAERDLRGLEPRVGWVHALAHTADLLRFLARDRRFAPPDQARLLDLVLERLTVDAPVFTHAEDERLAAAVVSVVRRDDFDAGRFDAWLSRFAPLEKQAWSTAPPEAGALSAAQNARNLLRALFVALSLPVPSTAAGVQSPPPKSVETSRQMVLATLQAIRR